MAVCFVRSDRLLTISGGAGGQKDSALIHTADLSKITHDPLLANLRYTSRKRYDFGRDAKEKMRVPYVHSTGNITPSQSDDACAVDVSP